MQYNTMAYNQPNYYGYAPPPNNYYPPNANQQPQQPPQQPQQQGQWGPPQGQYNPPPPGQWNQPPPQQQPQQQWGQYTAPPPAQVSGHFSRRTSMLGRLKLGIQALTAELAQPGTHYESPTHPRGGDPDSDAVRVHKAIAGAGTDDRELILTLCAVGDQSRMMCLRQAYDRRYSRETTLLGAPRNFLRAIAADTSGDYGELAKTLARTQAESDAYYVHKAIAGAGTSEDLLNDVLCARTNFEIDAMKQAYHAKYKTAMRQDVGDDLSAKTKELFMLILADGGAREDESAPCVPQQIQRDAQNLHAALRSSGFGSVVGKDYAGVMDVLVRRSNGQIRAINQEYGRMGWNLDRDIRKKFSGHMQDAFLIMLWRGVDPVRADAEQLERAMKGLGTNTALLSNAVVRVHWMQAHLNLAVTHAMNPIEVAYRQHVGKDLKRRIRTETHGHYRDLLVELLFPGSLT